MADYIRREDALKWVSIDGGDGCSSYGDCADRNTGKACSDCLYTDISRIPAADVEEVVHCKDCKYYDESIHYCALYKCKHPEWFYCYDGGKEE